MGLCAANRKLLQGEAAPDTSSTKPWRAPMLRAAARTKDGMACEFCQAAVTYVKVRGVGVRECWC